jgi:hypothetical protein
MGPHLASVSVSQVISVFAKLAGVQI